MITTGMIKELRDKTGAGVMICKKLLNETNGNMNEALDILKEQEAVLAAKKSDRATSEGLIGVYISDDKKTGALVEINCETDFVASNKDFGDFVNSIVQQISLSPDQNVESFLQEQYIHGNCSPVKEIITSLIARFGENINLSRLVKLSTKSGILHSYVHNGNKIGVIVELVCDKSNPLLEQIAKEIAMQVAATNPLFLNRDSVNKDIIEQQKESYKTPALSEGKSSLVIDKIVTGRINKFYRKNCLLEQVWIKNESMSIAELLKEFSAKIDAQIEITRFVRFELGKS